MGVGTRISQITDGTSNTIAMSEALRTILPEFGGGAAPDLATTHRAGGHFFYMTLGPNSASPDFVCGIPANCATLCGQSLPNLNRPCIGTAGGDNAYASPRSMHPGGVNALFCDGSVHLIPPGISLPTWRAMGTIAGGEVLGDF
jgi:prepilin-type processing-associated H-X9-DG protein